MKTPLSILALFSLTAVALSENIVVRVTDASGNPVQNADVVAILKSSAYQDAKFDSADGNFKCQPTESCVKVYAAAPGYEAATKRYSGASGTFTVVLKSSETKSSAVIRGSGPLPGLDGTVNPVLQANNVFTMGTRKIGLEKPGRFSVNRAIDAVTSTGQKFKIYVVDIMPTVSLLEFTVPK
jgi:hypothetical protein